MIVLASEMKRTLRKAGEGLFDRSGHMSTAHQFLPEHIGDQPVIFHHFHAKIIHNVVEKYKQKKAHSGSDRINQVMGCAYGPVFHIDKFSGAGVNGGMPAVFHEIQEGGVGQRQ